MQPSHLTSTGHDLVAEFFSGPGPVHVEARDLVGEAAPVQSRRVAQALLGAKRWVAGAVIGLSAVSGAAGASASGYSTDLPEMGMDQITQITRQAAGPKANVLVTAQAQKDNIGPYALIGANSHGQQTCTVSVYNIDKAAWQFSRYSTVQSAERLRHFALLHEASHCEFYSRMDVRLSSSDGVLDRIRDLFGGNIVKADGTAPIGNGTIVARDQQDLYKQLDSTFTKKVGIKSAGGAPLSELLSENYADVRAALLFAQQTIGQSKTHKEARQQFKIFGALIDDVEAHRRSQSGADLLHDSSDLMLKVKSYIAEKASTPEGLQELRTTELSDTEISYKALTWSVGSLFERSNQIHKEVIASIIESIPGELTKESKPNQHLLEVSKSLPQLKRLIVDNADLGYDAKDFGGGARKLAEESAQNFNELTMTHKQHTSAKENDALQKLLDGPDAMAQRVMSGYMLSGHKQHHQHGTVKAPKM